MSRAIYSSLIDSEILIVTVHRLLSMNSIFIHRRWTDVVFSIFHAGFSDTLDLGRFFTSCFKFQVHGFKKQISETGVPTESWTPRTRRRLNVYEGTGRNSAESV